MAETSGSKTMRMGVGVIGVAALGILAAIFFRGGGGSGTGGTGTGSGATTMSSLPDQTMAPATPQRPLKVVIRENVYEVDGRPVDTETLADMASKIPAGSGPAIMIERAPSSRAKAEADLRDMLNKKGITFASD